MTRWLPVLLIQACGQPPLPPIEVDASGEAPWVVDGAEEAAMFWTAHGAFFIVDTKGELKVEERADVDRYAGMFASSRGHRWAGTIYISSIMENKIESTPCVLAHEMGHALGMDHVEQGTSEQSSLMAPVVNHNKETGECWWSGLDEEEFCAHNPCEKD